MDILFTIIIYPVKLFIECVYTALSVSVFKNNIGVSLAGLSVAVNLLCLPLYARAEKLQHREREIQKRMAKKIAVIRRNFTGDERHMILSMYYRENHYMPLMALRSSLSLVMQIPFFIAAYSFLSHLDSLKGRAFFYITDLSAPDALFSVNGFSVNALPVIMTAINAVSALVYGGGLSVREKVQLYATPAIFLVLLYNSPSALVLYWTMNNVFSLIKNILYKVKNPGRAAYLIGCALFAAFMIYVLFFRYNEPRRAFRNKAFAVSLFVLFAAAPLFIKAAKYLLSKRLARIFSALAGDRVIFPLSCLCLWLLICWYIPVNMMASDPLQFAAGGNPDAEVHPLAILKHPVSQGFGLFIFWPVYLFLLCSRKTRSVAAFFFAGFSVCAFINFFVFQGNYGTVSPELTFKLPSNVFLAGTPVNQAVNIFACIAVFFLLAFVISFKKRKLAAAAQIVCVTGMIAFCVFKLGEINTFIARNIELRNSVAANGNTTINTSPPPPRDGGIETETIKPVFHFSRNEKNVFIVMLDGAVSSYFQIFLEKNPQYLKDYEGFTYYPNTASFFRNTIFGAVSLFGGYEYATYRMNERKDKLMKDKNNEAMLLLPELFKQNGFEVTVTNMPYINYETIEDPRFFTERGIHAEPVSGRYDHKFLKENLGLDEYPKPPPTDRLLRRNLLLFAAMETSVLGARDFIYQNGNYWSSVDYSLDSGLPSKTISNYTALYYLPQFINMDGTGGTLTIMVNDLTHDPVYLQFPDFTLRETVTETGENFFHNERSYKDYHVNAASYTLLARTFRYLKENGVWDNTRVIIVSDHGDFGIVHPEFSTFQNFHTLQYNPILLVKDFNAEGKLKTNNDFMTNADVPALALAGIVDNPVNPFTGNPVAADKEDGVYIYLEGNTNPNYYNGTTMLTDDSKFFHVRASIFDSENWREVRYRDFKTR